MRHYYDDDDDPVSQNALIVLVGLWVLSKLSWEVVPALTEAGSKAGKQLYEVLHNDPGHTKNLPNNPLSKAAVLQIAKDAGFPNPKLAAAIAYAESGGVVNALGDSGVSVGLWQINTRAHPTYLKEDMKIAAKNARAAFAISKGGTNWKPWSTYVNGKYKLYLTGVLA